MAFAKKIKILLLLIAVLFVISCKKNTPASTNPVPNTSVDITIYPNDPMYFKIQTPGGWVYIPGGVNGIIIYRLTAADFIALDRTSTYYPNDPAALAKVQSDNFTCKDTVSGSKWQIIDGVVISGPATYGLKRYNTYYANNNSLRIYN